MGDRRSVNMKATQKKAEITGKIIKIPGDIVSEILNQGSDSGTKKGKPNKAENNENHLGENGEMEMKLVSEQTEKAVTD